MAAPAVAVTDVPAAADIALVERELSIFNAGWSAPSDQRPLCVFVRDDDGAAIGGATGYTDRGWLYVDCLWLPEALRTGGMGSRILKAAEAEALARGCRGARLFTYSFQAEGFYARHGYTVFGVLEDFPPGHRQIWMRKDLV